MDFTGKHGTMTSDIVREGSSSKASMCREASKEFYWEQPWWTWPGAGRGSGDRERTEHKQGGPTRAERLVDGYDWEQGAVRRPSSSGLGPRLRGQADVTWGFVDACGSPQGLCVCALTLVKTLWTHMAPPSGFGRTPGRQKSFVDGREVP